MNAETALNSMLTRRTAIAGINVPRAADSVDLQEFVFFVWCAFGRKYKPAAEALGVTAPIVWRIVKGRAKDSKKMREFLGIGYKTAPAPVCAIHGVVHCYDCQTEEPRPKTNGSNRKAAPTPPYFKARRDDPEQVMRQLEKYFPGRFVKVE